MTNALYDVYVVNDHGVHDVLYNVEKDYAERCAAELEDGVVAPAGQRPDPKGTKPAPTLADPVVGVPSTGDAPAAA